MVSAGAVLCAFDDRDLRQQRAQLLAQCAVYQREEDRALAADDPVEARLAQANHDLMRVKLDIIDRRIVQSVVRSPIDGMLVAGDLRKQIGSVVARGDPLFAVAPMDRWTIELEVPEASVDEVKAGFEGVFAAYARPDQLRTFTVDQVGSAASIRHDANVFVAEAHISAGASWLRPGMEGVAKIHLGRRPVWWAVLHRAVDYLRMKLWL